MPAPKRRYLPLPEAADYIGRTPRAVYNLVHKRQIPYHKSGAKLLFTVDDLDLWMRKQRVVAP